jgi:ankyrin repeat protein
MNDDVPPYAILSHTWFSTDEEPTYEDLVNSSGHKKPGYRKIEFCATQAESDGLKYFWVDTCCIKKTSDAELSESINSMFKWYQKAARCYVYLPDVFVSKDSSSAELQNWEIAFQQSRWFSRGWTLQELLAPQTVVFFSQEGRKLGTRDSLKGLIAKSTNLPIPVLNGTALSSFPTEERLNWIKNRKVTREEDIAYCLLGIFQVSLPVIYGEGEERAMKRLQKEIRDMQDIEYPSTKRRRVDSDTKNASHTLEVILTKQDVLDALEFDVMDDRFLGIKAAHTKTCKWILKTPEYKNWLDAARTSTHGGLFWLKGKPGSGKSTMTKFVCQQLKKCFRDASVISFFFHARGEELQKTTLGLYRSLIYQLLQTISDDQKVWRIPGLTQELKPAHLKDNLETLKVLFSRILLDTYTQDVILVIDALDECHEDQMRDMLSFFEDLADELNNSSAPGGSRFRIFFSSRYYPYVTIRTGIEVMLDREPGHDKDIVEYLDAKLKLNNPEKLEQFKKVLLERSQRVFMWIVLVVQILNKAFDHGPVSDLAVQQKLQEIPDELHELLKSILTKDSEQMAQMKLCLQWILFATRQLTPIELYYAILAGDETAVPVAWDSSNGSSEDIERFILSRSKGLAEIIQTQKSKTREVQFIHESVRDFLLKNDGLGQIWSDLKLNIEGLSQDCLKSCCANHIRSNLLSVVDIPEELPRAKSKKMISLREEISDKDPFLKYAFENLYTHADISHAAGVDQKSFVHNFDCKSWINLYNIFQKVTKLRYPDEVGLLYIFSERNHPHLIKIIYGTAEAINLQDKLVYDTMHTNPIFAAVANNSCAALKSIIECRQVYQPDSSRKFPYNLAGLSEAVSSQTSLDIIEKLFAFFDISLDREFIERECSQLLERAIWLGHNALIDFVYANYKSCILVVSRPAWRAACYKGRIHALKILLENGADVNSANGMALRHALELKKMDTVRFLLENGADVNTSMHFPGSQQALHNAINTCDLEMVELILERGASINISDPYGGTPLHMATSLSSTGIGILAALLDRGVEINKQDVIGRTALHNVVWNGTLDLVQYLLSRGADINKQDKSGCTALHVAVSKGSLNLVQHLLLKGADINKQDESGYTALHNAVLKGSLELVQYLIFKGTDINKQDKTGNTALRLAAKLGRLDVISLDIVDFLLVRGASDL